MVRTSYSSLAAALALSVQTSLAVHGHGHGAQSSASMYTQTIVEVATVTQYGDGTLGVGTPNSQPSAPISSSSKSQAPAYVAPASSTTLQTKASSSPASSSAPSYGGGSTGAGADGTAIVQKLCGALNIPGCEDKMGRNAQYSIGPGSGAYTFDVSNEAGEDVALACGSALSQTEIFNSQYVAAHGPSFILPIKNGGTSTFSVGNDISAIASCQILSSKTSVNPVSYMLGNTMMEISIDIKPTSDGIDHSGVDVSTINNVASHNAMSITTFDKKGGKEACLSDMNTCSYNIIGGAIQPCRSGDLTSVDVGQGSTQGACVFKQSASYTGYAAITIS